MKTRFIAVFAALAVNGVGAVLSSLLVNPGAPYPECHASTIVELAPGRLAAAWFGGTKERNPDVGIWFARHEAGAWQPAVEVAAMTLWTAGPSGRSSRPLFTSLTSSSLVMTGFKSLSEVACSYSGLAARGGWALLG